METTQPKTCKRCQVSKPVTDFYAAVNGYGPVCRQCNQDIQRGVRARRPGYKPQTPTHGLTISERRAFLSERKSLSGCYDCGFRDDIRLLQFDHLPEFTKHFDISWGVVHPGLVTVGELKTEVAKCQVVCVGCHVRRTSQRARAGVVVPTEMWGADR